MNKTPKNRSTGARPFQPPTNPKEYWLYLNLVIKPVKKKDKKRVFINHTKPLEVN